MYHGLFLHVEHENTGDEDKKLESAGKVFKSCCFALNQDESDADEGIASYLSGVCGIARMMTGDGGSAEKSPRGERNSPAPGYRDGVASATKPGDVLTDVLLRLTFDNTAYVEEACDDAEASGLLPDKRSGNTPSIFIHLSRNSTSLFMQQFSFISQIVLHTSELRPLPVPRKLSCGVRVEKYKLYGPSSLYSSVFHLNV